MKRDRYNMWDEMKRLQDEMDTLFGEFFGGGRRAGRELMEPDERMPVMGGYTEPLADIFETENEIIATVELPGVNKEDISVNKTDTGVEVQVEKSDEHKDEDKKRGYYRVERRHTGFYRHFQLPSYADTDNIEASYKNGVLEIKVPKTEKGTDSRQKIEVK